MKIRRLKANCSHPTYKKLERIIALLENIDVEFEWINGQLKIRDTELNVSFDVLDSTTGKPQSDLPPLFEFKLGRDKVPISGCKCRFCNPNGKTNDSHH